jgi:chromosome segregation ATPase
MPSNTLIQRRIDTLEKKLECMYFRLGGEDLENGVEMQGLKGTDEFQYQILLTRNRINKIREDMDKRKENIKIHGYQNKERIMADHKILKSIEECEEDLKILQNNKKAAKYSPEDLKNRNKTIELLRKNLNLLRDEIHGEKANVSIDDEDKPQKIFGDYKDTDSDKISEKDIRVEMKDEDNKYDQRDLTDHEKQALEEFKKNDQELDAILDRVIAGLADLEDKGKHLNQQIDRQNEMLKQTNKKVEKTQLKLRMQNNNLKEVLQKIRSTNKLCCDLCLVFLFLGLIGVIIAILNSKGYF